MKLKYPHLPKTLGTIIQENYWSFYPSKPFRMSHFEMRYPVIQTIAMTGSIFMTVAIAFERKEIVINDLFVDIE